MKKNALMPVAALLILSAVACNKEQMKPAEPATQAGLSTMMGQASASTGFPSLRLMSKMRKAVGKGQEMDCVNLRGTCNPEIVIIAAPKRAELYAAIKGGAAGVRQLFSDETKAMTLLPDWNAAWFADVKAAILSGSYTFVAASETIFVLGKEGQVTKDNFDYAIQYQIL